MVEQRVTGPYQEPSAKEENSWSGAAAGGGTMPKPLNVLTNNKKKPPNFGGFSDKPAAN
jgi:hypothetical protein